MSFPFDPVRGLIIVRAELAGPTGSAVLRLALDTGATTTTINTVLIGAIGYDPATAPDRIQITTGSGVEFAARIPIQRLTALGLEQFDFPVLCHTLPPSAGVDGLLGLDFLRNRKITLDFERGRITMRDSKRS